MDGPLLGRTILVVEDEPLIALELRDAFENEGATVIVAHTYDKAFAAAGDRGLSVAIVDHVLGDRDSRGICLRLEGLNVPYVIYSGFNRKTDFPSARAHVNKPAHTSALIATVKGLLGERPSSN